MSRTVCVVPWTTLVVGPDGRASFCCEVTPPLAVRGEMGSIYRHSLDELWNADQIVQVRSSMARGDKPEVCRSCWECEAGEGASRRTLMNDIYLRAGGGPAVEELASEGAATGYVLDRKPQWFVLEMGNVCNLRCRSCSGFCSSRLAADSVHSAWVDSTGAPAPSSEDAQWFKNIDAVADMIVSGAESNAVLSLMGGEPFLIDATWELLETLVHRGVAPRIFVGVVTNGQTRNGNLAKLAPSFRGFSIMVSVDGFGKLDEYLRHGTSWHTLVENLSWLRAIPNVSVSVVPTLQNANALGMVDLLRFADAEDLALHFNALSFPARLRPANLPPSVRRIAAARMRAYLEKECRPASADIVRSYCSILEGAGESFDPDLFREFMIFSNDLDRDRGESLAAAAPDLVALVKAAGIEWSGERRHTQGGNVLSLPPRAELLQGVNRTVSPHDAVFAGFESGGTGVYFTSALDQIERLDALLREKGHPGLAGVKSVADFASHYGRMTRALRAALTQAVVYACDIDPAAVQFCAGELGALPVLTGWRPDEDALPSGLDAVICVSLLTHTPLDHWRRALRAWLRMLRPGGVAVFTFLSDHHVAAWQAGRMEHYGSYSAEARGAALRALSEQGHCFAALPKAYGDEPLYGVSFARRDVVRSEIEAAGLEVLALPEEVSPSFGQDLAIGRRPVEAQAPLVRQVAGRDTSVVAFYDPRCYAPAAGDEGRPAESAWARLAASQSPRPLPTELGFADPRIAEVREAQADLAREHGIDAFCYMCPWGEEGPRWSSPWRDLLATGRPDFPFCLMVDLECGAVSNKQAAKLFKDVLQSLRDPRYLAVNGRKLLLVRNAERLAEPRAAAKAWREAAAGAELGEIHLCATEPVPVERPADWGFDSFLQAPAQAGDSADGVSAALVRPWPQHRFFRRVECRRRDGPQAMELYEYWLRSAVAATRCHGETLVFVDSWNDWFGGNYLEPDDRDGRAALAATHRAVRGPASGLVLLRQLREAMGDAGARSGALLDELGQALAAHEHACDRLLRSVEAALGRDPTPVASSQRWVPVRSSQLPASRGGYGFDRLGRLTGEELNKARQPILLEAGEVNMAGWAHTADCPPDQVDLFLVLESGEGSSDRVIPVPRRVPRPDVVRAFPNYPERCGFDLDVGLLGLAPGDYRIAIVQRTPRGAWRDATRVAVRISGAPCSNK